MADAEERAGEVEFAIAREEFEAGSAAASLGSAAKGGTRQAAKKRKG
jgi:hypothetical protein